MSKQFKELVERQEPVAWLVTGLYEKTAFADKNATDSYLKGLNSIFSAGDYKATPLYTAPPIQETGCAECGCKASDGYALYCVKCIEPMREWVELTDAEIAKAVGSQIDEVYLADFRKVIAKLKDKNHE